MSTVTCPHASLLHGAMPASHAGDRSSLAPCLICSSRPALPDLNRQRGRGLGCRRAGRIAHVELCKHHVLGPGAVDCLVPPVTHPSCATHASVCTEPPTAAIACSAAKDDDDLLPVHQGSQILCGKLRKRDVPERQGASRSPSRPSVAIDELDALDAYHLPRSPTHPAAFDVDALRANRPDVTPCTSPLVSPVISRASSFQDVSPSDGAGAYERHSILDGTSCIHAASKACACWCLLELRDRVLLLCCFVHSDVKLTMGDPTSTTFNRVGIKVFFAPATRTQAIHYMRLKSGANRVGFCGGTCCQVAGRLHTTHPVCAYRVIICRCTFNVLLSQA